MFITIIGITIGVVVGYLVGVRHERAAGERRFALARKYWRSEVGASAVSVALAMIAVSAAYVGGHLLVFVLR